MGITRRSLTLTAVLATVLLLGAGCSHGPSTTATGTAACLAQEGNHISSLPTMPTPTGLATSEAFDFNGLRIDPPPAGATPRIPAARAWANGGNVIQAGGIYRLVLVSLSDTVPTFGEGVDHHVLAWVVLGSHVAMPDRGPRGSPPCVLESALVATDATTGADTLGEMGY
jgi:hypothetical protein